MLRLINAREAGFVSPRTMLSSEATRRCYALELSKYKDFQSLGDAPINCLDLDNNENRYVITGAGNGMILIYDTHAKPDGPTSTYETVASVGLGNRHRHEYAVSTVQWYHGDNGMFLSSGMDKQLKVWDTNLLVPADEFGFKSNVYHHQLTPHKHHCLVAVATQSRKVNILDLKSGSNSHVLKGHSGAVYSVKWSPLDEFVMASASADNRVLLWDIRHAKACLKMFDQHNKDSSADPASVNTAHSGFVNGLSFTSTGHHLVSFGTDNNVRLWDVASGANTLVNYGKVCNNARRCVQMTVSKGTNPDFVFVPSGNHIEIFDVFSGENIKTLRGHFAAINAVFYNDTTQELYSCSNDRNVLVWIPNTRWLQMYEDSRNEVKCDKAGTKFLSRIGAMADNWSSDED